MLNGQWLGKYSGSNSGTLVVDLDDLGNHFEGYAYAWDDENAHPSTYAYIRTPGKKSPAKFRVKYLPIDPNNGIPTNWNNISDRFPQLTFGTCADVELQHDRDIGLSIKWTSDIGGRGEACLPKSRAGEPSEYQPIPEVRTWSQFKEFASELPYRRHIFRGQANTLRLRTGFHRTGRADLHTFVDRDVRTLHRHLSQRTRHIFNLEMPDENGAFLNLVQHHGYPTPLLDWTYSPFVGAFFAYRSLSNSDAEKATEDDRVRIFVFDRTEWCSRHSQLKQLVARPHFSIIEFMAIENERLVPQQSISSVTNLDDIEGYVKSKETPNVHFLRIVELPIKERPVVMRDLAVMGITAGSLFPGLDGACEELKQRFFGL